MAAASPDTTIPPSRGDGPQLDFQLLGPLQVVIDGNPVQLGGTKPRAVLARLLISRNKVVSAEGLADAAWNEEPPAMFRNHLQVTIAKLRRSLQLGGLDPMRVLATAPPGYRLNVTDEQCDWSRFTRLRRSGQAHMQAGRYSEAATAYQQALAQWHGTVLADLRGYIFADEFAVPLDDELLSTQVERAQAEIACGRASAILGDLTALANGNPLHEPVWEQLATALYSADRPADALDALRRIKTTLDDELGVDPGPALQELELTILRQKPLPNRPATAPAPMAATVVGMTQVHATGAELIDASGQRYPIGSGSLRIGRMPDNNVIINEDRVSRYHAAVQRAGDHFVLRDLYSSNGVQINGERVVELANLQPGDVIRIGSTELRFDWAIDAG